MKITHMQPNNKFSLLALLAGNAHEMGLSRLAAEKYGSAQIRGEAIPHSRMLRDLNVSTSSAGGAIASHQELAAVSSAIRPQLLLERLGANRVEVNGAESISFPRFSGGPGGWLSEGASSISDTTAIDSVIATAHAAASRLALSRKVRNQSTQEMEPAVLRELSESVAATIEGGFFIGTGTNNQPLGLLNTAGIGAVTFAGATPTFAELVAMVEAYADADGDLAAAQFVLHPSDLADLLKAQISANGGETVIEYIDGAWRIAGIPCNASRHLTEGKHLLIDPTAISCVYFGPAQVVMDAYSNGKSISGAAEICVFNFCDVVLNRPSHVIAGYVA